MKNAIILAAGLGHKVWPYGEFRQKCTIPVANKPIIRRLVENLIEIGCSRIIVVVGHYAQQVRGVVADFPNVEFVTQYPLEGTADAVLAASDKLNTEDFLVIYGDIVTTSQNFRNIVKAFNMQNAQVAALIQPLVDEDASNWICVKTREDCVTMIEGHPRDGSYRLCGVYVFKAESIRYLLRNTGILTQVPVGGMPPQFVEHSGLTTVIHTFR